MGARALFDDQAKRRAVAERIVELHWSREPSFASRWGAAGREHCLQDALYHLEYLSQAVAADEASIFVEYVRWGRSVLAGRGIPEGDLAVNLECLAEVLSEELGEGSAAVEVVLRARSLFDAPETPSASELGASPAAELARRYLEHLLAGRRREAIEAMLGEAREGTPVESLYLDVLQPVQREVGRLWQTNEISIAHEHYCTAVTQIVMAQLYPFLSHPPTRHDTPMVAACAPEEQHELGVRMVADFFEMDGWDSHFLGSSVPTAALLRLVEEREIRMVALSLALPSRLGRLEETIARLREGRSLRILVGGAGFARNPGLAQKVGADGFAADAREAVAVGRRWLEAGFG